MAEAAILLTAFNGARFLPEQLDSLEAQQGDLRWTLHWRDDGSTDGTRGLLQDFRPMRGRVQEDLWAAQHLGAARGFLSLLAHSGEADIFAFCDQDDVWLPDKLQRAMHALTAVGGDVPAIYCSCQLLVNWALHPIILSPLPRKPLSFENALVQNVVTGCTLALNPAAKRLLLAAPPLPAGLLHDWWCYLLVTGAGGHVLFDEKPTVLYRQHRNNMVGSQRSTTRRALAAIARGPGRFMQIFGTHLTALDLAADHLTPAAVAKVRRLRQALAGKGYTGGAYDRLRAMSEAGLYRQTLAEDTLLRLWFLLGPLSTPPPDSLREKAGWCPASGPSATGKPPDRG